MIWTTVIEFEREYGIRDKKKEHKRKRRSTQWIQEQTYKYFQTMINNP